MSSASPGSGTRRRMKLRKRDCSRDTTSEIRWSCSRAIGSRLVAVCVTTGVDGLWTRILCYARNFVRGGRLLRRAWSFLLARLGAGRRARRSGVVDDDLLSGGGASRGGGLCATTAQAGQLVILCRRERLDAVRESVTHGLQVRSVDGQRLGIVAGGGGAGSVGERAQHVIKRVYIAIELKVRAELVRRAAHARD